MGLDLLVFAKWRRQRAECKKVCRICVEILTPVSALNLLTIETGFLRSGYEVFLLPFILKQQRSYWSHWGRQCFWSTALRGSLVSAEVNVHFSLKLQQRSEIHRGKMNRQTNNQSPVESAKSHREMSPRTSDHIPNFTLVFICQCSNVLCLGRYDFSWLLII